MRKEACISGGFLVSFLIAVTLSKGGQHMAAGLLLLCTAIVLYGCFYIEEQNLIDLRGLLSLFWIGGIGIAAFQLSNWQQDWEATTWLALGLFYLVFLWGYTIGIRCIYSLWKKNTVVKSMTKTDEQLINQRLYHCIWAVAISSMVCFILEVLIMGYIPIFAKETHAYNMFHVTGLHYFTFSCMMVHPLTLLYVLRCPYTWKKRWKMLALLNGMALSIAIMCVSKFQFVLTIMLPVIIFLLWVKKINWKKVLPIALLVGGLAAVILIVMVYRRNYEPGYLNGIFDMKNPNMPILLQYIYVYVANNFENFNCLVATIAEGTAEYAYGMRTLFPVFALTGLKFLFPYLVNYPIYVVVTELNTLTILYDAYYDLGLIGVVIFGALLGIVCALMTAWVRNGRNPMRYLFYGQVAMYQMLSFFSSWYSNPTTWFWFAITFLLYLYIAWCPKKEKKSI